MEYASWLLSKNLLLNPVEKIKKLPAWKLQDRWQTLGEKTPRDRGGALLEEGPSHFDGREDASVKNVVILIQKRDSEEFHSEST